MASKPLTDAEILAQVPAARARAERARWEEPHAAAARYDAATRRLVVSLTNGADFTVPVAHVAELAGAPEMDVAAVEVGPAGLALHWPALDADLSVAGLARVVFGLHVARAAGALGGGVRSEAKAAAARENGRRGGRPAAARELTEGRRPITATTNERGGEAAGSRSAHRTGAATRPPTSRKRA